MQITIAGWLKAQYEADFARVEAQLQAESDARQGPLDYEEVEHEVHQLESYLQLADADWS